MRNRIIALAGNPNVGKSTVFNELTGMHQHTGNWIGKTVELKSGPYYYKYNHYTVYDLPGTYSLDVASEEERLAGDFLQNGGAECTVCVVDSTLLERSLVLVLEILNITDKAVLLLNLCDEAKKKGIFVDEKALSERLGIPVVKATARSGKGINHLLEQVHLVVTGATAPKPLQTDGDVYALAKEVAQSVVTVEKAPRISPADRFMLGKYTSFFAIAVILGLVLWITVSLSNYPSMLLKTLLDGAEHSISRALTQAGVNPTVNDVLVGGVLRVLFWVVSVMLPPMAIFFPLFALLEDFGLLPRLAFNLDAGFEKCSACGKQALTCCMGLGCNAVGVTGARIMDSPRERLIAILTNSFTPCNGRFPLLIAVIGMFFTKSSLLSAVILLVLLGVSMLMTLLASSLLGKTVLKGVPSSFVMELPPYRKPQILKTVLLSMKEKVLFVLLRAVAVAAPAGLVIWLLANVQMHGVSLLQLLSQVLEPVGRLMGLDGVILLAFLVGFPANEIVLPIILMAYLSGAGLTDYGSVDSLVAVLMANGWTVKTALCTCLFSLFHFPCSTTLLTIFKETKSVKWTLLSVLLPLAVGVICCMAVNVIFSVL